MKIEVVNTKPQSFIKRITPRILFTLNILIFFSLMYSAMVLYSIGARNTATTILIILSLYVLFKRVDL